MSLTGLRCRHRSGGGGTPTAATSYALLGQAYVDDLVAGTPARTPLGEPATAVEQLDDLLVLARHIHQVTEPADFDLEGREADTWAAWTDYRRATYQASAVYDTAAPMHTARRLGVFRGSYATAVGLAAAVLASDNTHDATERLAPISRRDPQWDGDSFRLNDRVYASLTAGPPDRLQRLLAVTTSA